MSTVVQLVKINDIIFEAEPYDFPHGQPGYLPKEESIIVKAWKLKADPMRMKTIKSDILVESSIIDTTKNSPVFLIHGLKVEPEFIVDVANNNTIQTVAQEG